MTRTSRLVLTLITMVLCTVAPAGAAVTVGDPSMAAGAMPDDSISGLTFVQVTSENSTYSAPIAGVLTSATLTYTSLAEGDWSMIAVRNGKVVGVSAFSLPGTGNLLSKATRPVRIPVQVGDVLGIAVPPNITGRVGASTSSQNIDAVRLAPGGSPKVGDTLTLSSGASPKARMALAAQLEPDGDLDGRGDETQDACVNNLASFAVPCATNLAATFDAPAPATQGNVALLRASAKDLGPSIATAASLRFALPAGATFVDGQGPGGACALDAAVVACPLGDLALDQTARAIVIAHLATAGALPLSVTAAHAGTDAAPADDTASATITVTAPAATPTATPDPETVTLCTVPKLKGLTKAAARATLAAAGCRLGRASGPKRKSKVRTQSIPAATKVLAGTKVAIKLKRKR